MSWVRACDLGDLEREDVVRFDHAGQVYAIYRTAEDLFFATAGICTHEHACLADGLVLGTVIECPKHNGRFDCRTGKALGAPVTVDLRTYAVRVESGAIFIQTGD